MKRGRPRLRRSRSRKNFFSNQCSILRNVFTTDEIAGGMGKGKGKSQEKRVSSELQHRRSYYLRKEHHVRRSQMKEKRGIRKSVAEVIEKSYRGNVLETGELSSTP